VFIVYVLDNTVKDKQEFEELTGLNVIAYIEKDKKKK
jgi:capsular polysaccharide biosynthesis protein